MRAQRAPVPNEGVHLDGINAVQVLDGSLDVVLAGTDITDKDQCILVLDLAHRRLRVQRELDDGKVVQAGLLGNSLAAVLGGTAQLQRLGQVEAGARANLAGRRGMGALEGGLARSLGLLDL